LNNLQLPAVFTCFVGIVVGEMYTRTGVIIRRLNSSAQSPVFSQFSDTLSGLSVIRARADMPEAFCNQLADRMRLMATTSQLMYNINRWIGVRVDFITSLVALGAGMIALSKSGVVAAGLVGFSLTNATGLSDTILGLVRIMNEVEIELQSVSSRSAWAVSGS
jgi:hypothetical protein